MKVEYLPDGSPDCPLIRFYGVEADEFVRLLEVFRSLSKAPAASLDIADDPTFTLVNLDRLGLKNVSDPGLLQLSERSFTWSLRPHDWETAALLLEPLTELTPDETGFQWLYEGLPPAKNGIAILASHSRDGCW